MKILTKDKVKIIAGKDKGKEGSVVKVWSDKHKIVVEGVNIVKKHVKPGAISKEGGIISVERPIAISNAMVVCPKCNKPVKIGYSLNNGKKYRVCKKCGEVLSKAK